MSRLLAQGLAVMALGGVIAGLPCSKPTFEQECHRLGGWVEQRDCGIYLEPDVVAGQLVTLPVQRCHRTCVIYDPEGLK